MGILRFPARRSPFMESLGHDWDTVLPNTHPRDADDKEEQKFEDIKDDVDSDEGEGYDDNFVRDFHHNLEVKMEARRSMSLLVLFVVSLVVGLTCAFLPGSTTFIGLAILFMLFTAIAVAVVYNME